jgi:flagellar protein FliO/FliZ
VLLEQKGLFLLSIRMLVPLLTLVLFLGVTLVHADQPGSVYDAIQGGGGVSPAPNDEANNLADEDISLFPFLVKLFFSLIFIILLIYLLLKFLATKTRKLQSRGPFVLLGGCVLAPNRSLQMVLIGNTVYLLGVGENVQLIRTIAVGDGEYEMIMNKWENPTSSGDFKGWLMREQADQQEQQMKGWSEFTQQGTSPSWVEQLEKLKESRHS